MPSKHLPFNFFKWKYVLKPKEDEIFSAWFSRNAFAHACTSYYFSSLVLNDKYLWYGDTDRILKQYLIDKIKFETGISTEELTRLFVSSILPINLNKNSCVGIIPFLMCAGIYHTTRYHYGLSYCPSCLRDYGSFKTYWRLAYYIHCPEHDCELLDSCPHCDSPIVPHKVLTGNIAHCFNCQKCLTDVRSSSCSKNDLLMVQYCLTGLFTLGPVTNQFSAYFNDTIQLRKFIRRLLSIYTTKAINKTDLKTSLPFGCFEKLRIEDRKKVLTQLYTMLSDWPHSVLKELANKRIKKCFFYGIIGTAEFDDFLDKLPKIKRRSQISEVIPSEIKRLYKKKRVEYKERRASCLLIKALKK